jgi:hypothetical protein
MTVDNYRVLTKRNHPTDIRRVAAHVDARVLAATASEEVPVPTSATIVIITSDVGFYANFNATSATLPVDNTSGASAVYLPTGMEHKRVIDEVSSFGVWSTAATVITMEFFK